VGNKKLHRISLWKADEKRQFVLRLETEVNIVPRDVCCGDTNCFEQEQNGVQWWWALRRRKEREGGREGRREGRKEGRKEEKSFSDVIISFHWGKGSAVSVRYRENTFLQFIQSRKTY